MYSLTQRELQVLCSIFDEHAWAETLKRLELNQDRALAIGRKAAKKVARSSGDFWEEVESCRELQRMRRLELFVSSAQILVENGMTERIPHLMSLAEQGKL